MSPRRGNAAVEFALAGTVLIVMLFGLMEWGWYLFQWFGASRASQAGVRMAAVTDIDSDVSVAATAAAEAAMAQWGINPAGATVETTLEGAVGSRTVTVKVTVTDPNLVGLVPSLPQAVALHSQRYEEVAPFVPE